MSNPRIVEFGYKVEVPEVPESLRMQDGSSVEIASLPDGVLEQIGKEWADELLAKAQLIRAGMQVAGPAEKRSSSIAKAVKSRKAAAPGRTRNRKPSPESSAKKGHSRARLSDEVRAEVVRLKKGGASYTEIFNKTGVSHSSIARIITQAGEDL